MITETAASLATRFLELNHILGAKFVGVTNRKDRIGLPHLSIFDDADCIVHFGCHKNVNIQCAPLIVCVGTDKKLCWFASQDISLAIKV
jgi:hypothetical protein